MIHKRGIIKFKKNKKRRWYLSIEKTVKDFSGNFMYSIGIDFPFVFTWKFHTGSSVRSLGRIKNNKYEYITDHWQIWGWGFRFYINSHIQESN